MARDYCLKVYGKSHWKDYTAEQVFTGWLFYYDWWRVVPYKLKANGRIFPGAATGSGTLRRLGLW